MFGINELQVGNNSITLIGEKAILIYTVTAIDYYCGIIFQQKHGS